MTMTTSTTTTTTTTIIKIDGIARNKERKRYNTIRLMYFIGEGFRNFSFGRSPNLHTP